MATQTIWTIGDLSSEVVVRCENRANDLARTYVWLRDTILEVTADSDFRNEFDELEVVGPLYNLTVNLQEYAFSNLVTAGDYNMGTLDVRLWRDPPTNSVRQKLDQNSYQQTDKSLVTTAPPTSWYRFGDTIGFYPVPDKAYQVQARLLKMHPMNDTNLDQTVVLLARDWHEILIWGAVERGFMELGEFDKAAQVHIRLHGDPKYPGRAGILDGRKKRRERESWRDSKSLRPVVGRYGAR